MQRAVECALDAGFVARQSFKGAGAGGVIEQGARTGIEGVLVVRQLRHADVEQTGFEGAHAAQAPGADGHLLDEQSFGGSGGQVFGEKGIEEFLELGVFAWENAGLGGEAVAKRVEADGGASFRSARAGAVLGVATISVDLTLGSHRVDCWGRSRDQDSAEDWRGRR